MTKETTAIALADAILFIEHISGITGYPGDDLAREEYDDKLKQYRAALSTDQQGVASDKVEKPDWRNAAEREADAIRDTGA